MAELHHISHHHPLVFSEDVCSPSGTTYDCAGCAKPVLGSTYGCGDCRFYLHKKCAEAPWEIHHPAHSNHPLLLLPPSQHPETGVRCGVCYKKVKGFIYHCSSSSSCEFYLDIDCALLTHYTSDGNLIETLYETHHSHPLISINPPKHVKCYACCDPIRDASYACFDCRMFFHKKCLQLPAEINHPYHREHHLRLVFPPEYSKCKACSFCNRLLMGFVYHCSSCELYLDMNCASLPRDTGAAGNFNEILHVAHPHPLISINPARHLRCSGCFCQIKEASYACFDCKKLYHKKCLELPTSINHPCHRKHRLMLDFNGTDSVCILCRRRGRGEFFYRCVPCKIEIHAGSAWPPPIIENKSRHDHPFTLLLKPNNPFLCDACGTKGDNVSYICSTCNIQVHKGCTSLPRHITLRLHPHPISHCFFLCIDHNDSRTWDCRICFRKVDIEHGSYYCPRPGCDFVIHVQCSIKKKYFYGVSEIKNPDEFKEPDPLFESMSCIFRIIKEIKVGDDVVAGEIEHVSHEHNLILSDEFKDYKFCNGCVLPLLSSFYYCPRCDFFIHKTCAELPRKYQPWLGVKRFNLCTNGIFVCGMCRYYRSGFYYKTDRRSKHSHSYSYICIKCASISHSFTYQADKPHFIFFVENHEGKCNACCKDLWDDYGVYRCKDCTFCLDFRCLDLPRTAWHKCDQHSLTLAYQDPDDYPLRHYCDICEERRDPRKWYYRCETCDNSLHIKCVIGKYSFIRIGSKYTCKHHQHPLTFVRKMHYYPECNYCGKPCQDLALECEEHGCKYIVHWTCIKPYFYGDDGYSSTGCLIGGGTDSGSDTGCDSGGGTDSGTDTSCNSGGGTDSSSDTGCDIGCGTASGSDTGCDSGGDTGSGSDCNTGSSGEWFIKPFNK